MTPLTVIVPFFDEIAYLRSALTSIHAQGIDGIEVLVVNDNPDQFDDSSVSTLIRGLPARLIRHPANLGLSAARNTGLRAATGKWIAFLDSDDYYILGGLARHLDRAMTDRADITHAPTLFTRAGSPRPQVLPRDAAFFLGQRAGGGLRQIEEAQFITSSWSSLYCNDFLRDHALTFDEEQTRFEDRLFVLHSVSAARSLAFVGTPTRVWRGRAGSISVTATTPETHLLQVQLLEKCLAHMRAQVDTGQLPQRFAKRELFNCVSRLIWDMDLIEQLVDAEAPIYRDLAKRIPALLGDESFGQAIFEDPILKPVSRVGMRTRRGRIARSDFFDLHRFLRIGDFASAAQRLRDRVAASGPVARTPARAHRSARRLVLHLGLHKTGSTHLQNHLIAHRDALLAQRVLVPRAGFVAPDDPLRDGATPGHQGLVQALRANDPLPFAELGREIRASGAETVLISCENMGFPTNPDRADLIARLLDQLAGFEHTDLVALVRRPDIAVERFYREWVADGAPMGAQGIAAFLVDHAEQLCDLPALFAPFEARLNEKVKLADFDALAVRGLWPGFAELTGLPEDLPALDLPRYPTPDRNTILLLQSLNAMVRDPERRAMLVRAWFRLHPAPGDDASLLDPDARLRLLDLWQERSADFAATRGYAPDLAPWRAALTAEPWEPATVLPAPHLADLIDLMAQSERPENPAPAPQNRPARPQGPTLTIRLRPWAANLIARLNRR